MIMLAAALIAGDRWTWDVTLRYDDPKEGPMLIEKERWNVEVGVRSSFVIERKDLGTQVGDDFIPFTDPEPERIKGEIQADGSLSLKAKSSDPAVDRTLKALLNPNSKLVDRVAGYCVLRSAAWIERNTQLPGSGLPAILTVEVKLTSARLGGKDVPAKVTSLAD